ncbi:MAG TPA: type II toxin-antitoxin system YafQ family toxin [Flavobacteriaceae bacterium]|nr:type II toxin-antitoxin system YafQ family toxin [Flavobacteriaceae bacterium]
MYQVVFSNTFKRDIKRCKKRHFNFNLLKNAINDLEKSGKLSPKYKSHKLSGNYKGFWECHIKPDWLLIWEQDNINKILYFERTGTHSDLFH